MWAAGTQGPMAPPGTYQVKMLVDGALIGTERFTLKKDPRTTATPADLAAQFADERQKLEQQWDRGEEVSTEELRLEIDRLQSA